jgi:hypothetical protein
MRLMSRDLSCGIVAAGAAVAAALMVVMPACTETPAVVPTGQAPDAGQADAAIESGPCAPFDAGALDEASVARGKALAMTLQCDMCHGETFTGNNDGVRSPQTVGGQAYPPNLTSDPATGLGCWTDDQIETALLYGIDNEGMPLCPPMPLFVEAGVDPSGAAAIVSFLRSLPSVASNVPATPDCTGTSGEGGSDDASDDSSSDGAASDAVSAGDDADDGHATSADSAADGGQE